MENTIYISAAAALGLAIALAVFFLRRNGAADAAPAKGSAFGDYGEHIKLRDLFRLASLIEEQGEALYAKMELKAARPETKKLCAWLAEQEGIHRGIIQDQISKWRPLPPHLTEWPAFMERVKKAGFFADPPAENAAEDELAAFAIRQEIKTAEFYALFEQAFPQAWKRVHMRRLVEEEHIHEARLREAYPHIR